MTETDLGVTIRRARPGDAAELTRLRGVMFESVGVSPEATDWRQRCVDVFTARLAADDGTFAAVVAEDVARPGHVLACCVGWVEAHLPSPGNPSGRRGHVANVATNPSARRRGLGMAVLTELMAFFAEQDVVRVDLHATPMGEGLYRSLGFREPRDKGMSWRRP
jgi:ribosomal protein S18 acetylase RimI-like enzyme